jgi:hypothetical protein
VGAISNLVGMSMPRAKTEVRSLFSCEWRSLLYVCGNVRFRRGGWGREGKESQKEGGRGKDVGGGGEREDLRALLCEEWWAGVVKARKIGGSSSQDLTMDYFWGGLGAPARCL